jgi:gliding motility-associated-like protein
MLTPGYAFHSYVWNSSQELNDSYLYATVTGLYTVGVANECGDAVDTVFVEFLPLPEVHLGNDTVLQYDTYITLDAGNSFSVYRWQDGSGSSLFMVDLPGTYSVEVADESGCKGSDTILVMPVPFRIHVPTAFSPNGDGVNDLFRAIPSSAAPHEFRMMVFSRWGERVFDSNDISLGWDGTYNGVPCPVEVYLWVVETR